MPTPQMPYPATLPAPSVSYSRNVMDGLVTEVTVGSDTHRLWTGSVGVASDFRGNRSPYFNTLTPSEKAGLIAWAEDVHRRAASASPKLQADLIGE
jgi:hypothetical protein